MKAVGIRTLKRRLAEYVRLVRCGERLTVTRRSVPAADLVPRGPQSLDPDDELARLTRAGKVRLGNPNASAVHTRSPRQHRLPDEVVAALLDKVRGER